MKILKPQILQKPNSREMSAASVATDQTQESIEFYHTIKDKFTNRFGTPFVQEIPEKVALSMQWFTKQGGHATVNVQAREGGGIRIEFTKSTITGICKRVVGQDNFIDIMLYTGVTFRFMKKEKTRFFTGVFHLNREYTPNVSTRQLVMDLLWSLLVA